jgi:energy-coupling factor transporter ATP-binding protein EcfA2
MFRHVRDGLTLVTGVTGSGKSTTLDAVVDANNEDFDGHIVIVAKPVEYMHTSKKCIVRHREVGQDVPTFKDGIIQALRQDPDIIVVGEMRDPRPSTRARRPRTPGTRCSPRSTPRAPSRASTASSRSSRPRSRAASATDSQTPPLRDLPEARP